MRVYYYEIGGDQIGEYNIPENAMFILVFRNNNARGFAIGCTWKLNYDHPLYINVCHDTWKGWVPIK